MVFLKTSNNYITGILNNTNIFKIILFNNGQTKRINININFFQTRLNPTFKINVTLNVNKEEIEKLTNLNIVDLGYIRFMDSSGNPLLINNVDFKIYYKLTLLTL